MVKNETDIEKRAKLIIKYELKPFCARDKVRILQN